MTIKPLPKINASKIVQTKSSIGLSLKDGWNFGLGFSAALFIFSLLIVPTIFCLISILVMVFGSFLRGAMG